LPSCMLMWESEEEEKESRLSTWRFSFEMVYWSSCVGDLLVQGRGCVCDSGYDVYLYLYL
jgi:hypothetical protein